MNHVRIILVYMGMPLQMLCVSSQVSIQDTYRSVTFTSALILVA